MLSKINTKTDKKTSDAKNKFSVFFSEFAKYLVSIFLVLGWTIVISFSTPVFSKFVVLGYVLLFILMGCFKKIKWILFTGAVVFSSYLFLFFNYHDQEIFHPLLDIVILLLSATVVILAVNSINKNYTNLFKEMNKIEETESSSETMVVAPNEKLQESSAVLENKVRERTETLEETRRALINLLEDAEESKRTIELERNKTRAALISLVDGLIVFDSEKNIVLVNPEAERILKIKEEKVINKKIDQITSFENLDKLYESLGRKIEWTGQRYELILGEMLKRFFQVSVVPISVNGETTGLMVILHDITREKEVERLKSEFVSIAAHQLRTPLSATKWVLRMLLDGDIGKLSDEQIDFLEKGQQSNERMILLVNDLLNVAHIEEGRFIYKPTLHSIENIAQRIVDGVREVSKKRNIKIIFNKSKNELSKKVKVDEKKIELVIQNLLDNAIRFTKPGGMVTISIKYDKVNVEVSVKDVGVGIPEKQQSRIFTKFFRADNVVKMETEGSGLGLFICKNIVQAHGGKIWFESEENKGTTFYFTIPLNSKL